MAFLNVSLLLLANFVFYLLFVDTNGEGMDCVDKLVTGCRVFFE